MRNIAKRILSLALGTLLAASSFSVASSAAASAKDPKAIEKLVVDFRNEESFNVHG